MKLNKTHPMYGKCYVVAETLWHATGKRLTPMRATHQGISHWWLRGPGNEIIDPTAGQFLTAFPYHKGRPQAFLTQRPSKRTKEFLYETIGN